MKPENLFFDVTPRILPADRNTTVTIRPLFDHCRFDPGKRYELSYFPCEQFALCSGWKRGQRTTVSPGPDGSLRVPLYFEGEQEHVLLIESVDGEDRKPVGDFRVYSVAPDLLSRQPWKGDFHIHSSRSDGREAPAYVAAAARRIGLDFMAVTDHRAYAPSIEAQDTFAGVPLDLRICRGEEVHPPDNPVHIINFGGEASVNALFAGDAYRDEVAEIMRAAGPVPEGVSAYQNASCRWCFDRIRQFGGLGIFCHPYWFTQHAYAPAGNLTSHLFDTQPFDAYEVIGGYFLREAHSNTLQVARYHEERARGRRLPIVGVSDAHGCERGELFGWYYTIAFAPTPDLGDVIDAVRGLYSVAVEALPGELARPVGPFRLVKYALFLMREVLPLHDELCIEEGRQMQAHLAGDPDACEELKRRKGRCAAYYARAFAAS